MKKYTTRQPWMTDEEWDWVKRGLTPVAQNEPCARPVPTPSGTGVCLRCGWQHAERGPNAIESWA